MLFSTSISAILTKRTVPNSLTVTSISLCGVRSGRGEGVCRYNFFLPAFANVYFISSWDCSYSELRLGQERISRHQKTVELKLIKVGFSIIYFCNSTNSTRYFIHKGGGNTFKRWKRKRIIFFFAICKTLRLKALVCYGECLCCLITCTEPRHH